MEAGMEMYEKLIKLAEKASEEQELPDSLLAKIKKICTDRNADPKLITELSEMLEEYEPFADVGCGNESYSTKDIENLLKKIG